tara:strand:- start:716 stop:1204 length:489 start_codon:yes stop_codon:yes gene_type:complete
MTKNKIFTEIKLAMRAGHYRDLTHQEKQIYKNAFKNGYKLARLHIKKDKKPYEPRRIIGFSFAKPSSRIIDSIINKICIRYEVHKESLMSKTRTQDLVRARNIIHNLLYEKYNLNLTDIGRYFKQDHTTVLHSIEMKRDKQRFWDAGQSIWSEFQELKETIG